MLIALNIQIAYKLYKLDDYTNNLEHANCPR